MEFSESRTEQIPVQLEKGAFIKVEVAITGREDVAIDIKPFKEVTDAIEGNVEAIAYLISDFLIAIRHWN